MIYFVQAVCGGPIKIGYTDQAIHHRLGALQTGSPVPLQLLAIQEGSLKDEKALHWRFDHLRLHGEWFANKEELIEYVVDIGTTLLTPSQDRLFKALTYKWKKIGRIAYSLDLSKEEISPDLRVLHQFNLVQRRSRVPYRPTSLNGYEWRHWSLNDL